MNEMTMQVEMLPVRLLVPSPTNPRKFFSAASIAELVLSLSQHGVKTPLSVRSWPAGRPLPENTGALILNDGESFFEIVAGERRYRAAKGADLEQVPCIVQQMTDSEVLEVQLIENLQRVDLQPLEEAGGYQQMLELPSSEGTPAYTVDTIALKIGKGVRHVYSRLRLLRMPESAQDAMRQGILPSRQGEIIAQQPTAELREVLTKAVLNPEDGTEAPLSVRAVMELVRTRFMRSLKGIPWGMDDADLCPAAGACRVCPHRTGNMPDIADDLASTAATGAGDGDKRGGTSGVDPNVCVNPTCFRTKQDAYWERSVAEAQKSGQKVLSDTEAEKQFHHGGDLKYSSAYVEATSRPENWELKDGVKKAPTWEKIATAGETKAPIVLARDPSGKVHRLVERTLAVAAAKENKLGILKDEPGRSSQDETRWAEERKQKKALETQRLAMDLAMERMTASPCLRLMTAELVGLMTGRLVWETASDLVWSVVKRRALGGTIHVSRTVLSKAADKMTMEEQTALMAELLFFQTYSTHSQMTFNKEVKRLAEFCGVDLHECRSAAVEQLLQRKAQRGKKTPPPWTMPADASEKIFAAWLAKEKAELAATPASRVKARGDESVRAEFVLWLSLQKAKAGSGRKTVPTGKVQAHADTNGLEPGDGTKNRPFKWNKDGVCLNPEIHTVKFSAALAKKWKVQIAFGGTNAGWGWGYDLNRMAPLNSDAGGAVSAGVNKDKCDSILGDAVADAKTFVESWLTEHNAPGAVTLTVAEFFEKLQKDQPPIERTKLPKEARAAMVATAKARWAKQAAAKKGGK